MNKVILFPLSFIKFTFIAVSYKSIGLIGCFLIASASSLIIMAIEWCLWKIYIMAIIEWICHYLIYEVIALPIAFIIWCYSNMYGFMCLVGIVMASYCIKHAIKSRNDNDYKRMRLSD